MKKLLQRILRWSFKNKIVILSQSVTVREVELVLAKYPVYNYHYKEIALRIIDKMIETEVMKFTQERDIKNMNMIITGKIYVIKV